ncbi:MAG: histidine kinase [Eubacteriales bacterium]
MVFFVNRILAFIMYSGFLVQALILYNNYEVNRNVVLTLYAVLLAIMFIHLLSKISSKNRAVLENVLLVFGLIIALIIYSFDTTAIRGLYIFFILTIAVLYDETRFGVLLAIAGYFAFTGMYYYKTDPGSFYDFFNRENSSVMAPRTGTLVLFYIIRRLIFAGKKNGQLARSLQKKNEETEALLKQNTAYSAELEKTADLRAREKLMNELHNKLGHVLATASIGAQAAAVLVDKDSEAAKQRLDIVAQQIQTAMHALRDVVSGGESSIENSDITFNDSILKLIGEMEKRTDVPVRHNISAQTRNLFDTWPVSIRSLIYNVLMEGLTNGLRHGKATAFDFELTIDDDKIIRFSLKDNGVGFDSISFGNGLSKMQRDAEKTGAVFEITGANGCTIAIDIPPEAYIKGGTST